MIGSGPSIAQRMMSEQGIRPAGQPKVDVNTFEEGSDLEFTVSLDVMPEITQPDFSKIRIEKMVVKVDDKDVDEQLQRRYRLVAELPGYLIAVRREEADGSSR